MGTKAGANRKYIESPEKLWEYFMQYVEKERNSPMYRRDYVGKEGLPVDTPLQIPVTWEGFELFMWDQGVIRYLNTYVENRGGRYSKYVAIVTRIKNFIFSQNFNGASVGLFQQNIIARKLGLVDKKENKVIQIQEMFPDVPADDSDQQDSED